MPKLAKRGMLGESIELEEGGVQRNWLELLGQLATEPWPRTQPKISRRHASVGGPPHSVCTISVSPQDLLAIVTSGSYSWCCTECTGVG